MKWLRYVSRAFELASLLAVYVPMIMADGKITVDELVEFARKVFEIGGWKFEIELPGNIKGTTLNAKVE
uniref:Uncharacterized protein n=1 Tax=viral metagenome TaxID=1070528 RepID=A0A6M3JTR5_9ZZZZ